MTPSQELREAARLLRERAGEAEQPGYDSMHPGKPWCQTWTQQVVRHVQRNMDSECYEHSWGSEHEDDCNQWGRYAGHHIAGMHPGVALALADWLDSFESRLDDREYDARDWNAALKVARVYLGESV